MATLPLRYELTVYGGTTFRREFRWLPDGETPQDFTGWTGQLRISPINKPALITVAATLTSAGHIMVWLDPVATATLAEGTYRYVLDLTNPDGDVIRFLRGRCEVIRDDT